MDDAQHLSLTEIPNLQFSNTPTTLKESGIEEQDILSQGLLFQL